VVPLATHAALAFFGPRRARERECSAAADDLRLTTTVVSVERVRHWSAASPASLGCIATSTPMRTALPRPPFRAPVRPGPKADGLPSMKTGCRRSHAPASPSRLGLGITPTAAWQPGPPRGGPSSPCAAHRGDTGDCPIRLFGLSSRACLAHPSFSFHRTGEGVRWGCQGRHGCHRFADPRRYAEDSAYERREQR
jgi:hypothetical protein